MAYFSATVDEILRMYPQTSATDFGGEEAIEDALQAHTDNIIGLLNPDIYNLLQNPSLELVVKRATDQQTEAVLGLTPIADEGYGATSVRLYRIPFSYTETTNTVDFTNQQPCYKTAMFYEIADEWDLISVNNLTGYITFDPLSEDDLLYASYITDVQSLTIVSLARAVRYGTAYEIGSKVYAVDTNSWKLVEEYKNIWEKSLETIESSSFIPSELRKLRWLNPINMKPALKVMGLTRSG